LWLPEYKLIVIKSGMRSVHDRSALAHELAHAALGHRDDRPKHEMQADCLAAQNLIDLHRCKEVMKWAPDVGRLAHELDVSTRLLLAFLHHHQMAS
jgi:Zn-dependent peptidase ImmA (M78 family)